MDGRDRPTVQNYGWGRKIADFGNKKDCHMGNLEILYRALGWQNPLPFYILANYRNKNYSSRRVFTSKILLLFFVSILFFTSRFYIELNRRRDEE